MTSDSSPDSRLTKDSEASILDHICDLVSVVDRHYRYQAVSQGYVNFFGLPRSDIVGRTVCELHGEMVFYESLKPALDKTLAGEDHHLQFWRENHKGEMRFLDGQHNVYNGPLTDGPGVAVVVRDITEVITAQQALEQERQLLSTIINAVPDMIFMKDMQRRYQLCNDSFAEFLGLDRSDIIGNSDRELMSERSAAYITSRDDQVLEQESSQRCDEWVSYTDGRRRLLDMYKLPLRDQQNNLIGLVGIGRNVTFERETEQRLLTSSLLFETTSDPCFILSETGLILSTNSAAKHCFNQGQQNTAPAFFSDLFHIPSKQGLPLQEIIGQSANWQGELFDDSNHSYLVTISRVGDSNPQMNRYVAVLRSPESDRQLTDELINKAYHDPLTSLPNRLMFMSRLESAIIRSERQQRKLAVLFIDLNEFKPINDQFGHTEGDKLLQKIAKALAGNFRATDTLARIGGDEFVALIDIETPEAAVDVARKILASLEAGFTVSDTRISISASIGISLFPGDGGTATELICQADKAMYLAKRGQQESYAFTSESEQG